MEYGNIAKFFESAFNLKASWRSDIFQVDAAKAAGDQINSPDDLFHVLRAHTDRKSVYIAKFLEQRTFALHHRHTCLRTDIPQSKHRRTVRHDRHKVTSSCQRKGFFIVLIDLQTRLSNARSIGKRKLLRICDRRS